MTKISAEFKEQRLQQLFDDCQQQIISQVLGPFGLSAAMFEDRNGGNVTTWKNFKKDADDYIAEKDKSSHKQSNTKYDREALSDPGFANKSRELRSSGGDGLTGKKNDPNDLDADHTTPLIKIWENKKVHLSLETGNGLDKVKAMANSDENLVATHKSINRSKGAMSLDEFAQKKGEHYSLDPKLVAEAQERSEKHINSTIDNALLRKQSIELMQTGGHQAMQMGLRQALGVLLTELVNGLFNEFKVLIQHGVEAGKTLFKEIRQRLERVIKSVIKKIPDAVSQLFEGGVSGFMSNLLTFVLNSFLSTAKRFVRAIREGFLSLYKAFKLIFFTPEHMTKQQGLQEGLKVLTVVVVTTLGILLEETVAAFMVTVPFLKPVADILTPVLIGIVTGLLSAFLAYQIDCMFHRLLNSYDEKQMDELFADAKRRDEFASELIKLSEASLENIKNYSESIATYQNTGEALSVAGSAASAISNSLEATIAETREQVVKSHKMINSIHSDQLEIENFLKTI